MSVTLLPNVITAHKHNNVFLETGSYKGGGIQVALDAGFSRVISIEIHKEYHEICKQRFATQIADGIVELHLGDCLTVLQHLLPTLTEPTTFWLDAHIDWECGISGKTPSPLIFELGLIRALSPNLNHTFLIDDMRVFRTKIGWGMYNPVGTEEIESAIKSINKDYIILYEPNSVQADDVLVAYIP